MRHPQRRIGILEAGAGLGSIAVPAVEMLLGPGHAQQLFQPRNAKPHTHGNALQHRLLCGIQLLVRQRQRHQEHQQGLLQLALVPAGLKVGRQYRLELEPGRRTLLKKLYRPAALRRTQVHLFEYLLGMPDLELGDSAIGLGHVTGQQERGLEEAGLDPRNILRRTELQGGDQPPVKGVAYRHTQDQAEHAGHHQANQATYYLAVEHGTPYSAGFAFAPWGRRPAGVIRRTGIASRETMEEIHFQGKRILCRQKRRYNSRLFAAIKRADRCLQTIKKYLLFRSLS